MMGVGVREIAQNQFMCSFLHGWSFCDGEAEVIMVQEAGEFVTYWSTKGRKCSLNAIHFLEYAP